MVSGRDLKLAALIVTTCFFFETVFRGGRHSREPHVPHSEGAAGLKPSHEPHYVQETRASERDRGRRASNPLGIPFKGWKDIAWRCYAQIQDNRLMAVAAGVVFYILLALFPAVGSLVSLYGLFADPKVLSDHLTHLQAIVPAGGISILEDQFQRLMKTGSGALGLSFLFNLAFSLWSANAGMKAIIDALNVAYDEREKRSFVRLSLVAFAFTLGALVFFMLAVSAIVALPLIYSTLGLTSGFSKVLFILRWPIMVAVIVVWLAILYRFGPSRTQARWEWLTVGSVFAAATWFVMSYLFSWYLSAFANYDATYGSLGAAIGLMMWLWLSVIVMLLGAQLNAEIEHQTATDTTLAPEKPLGARGAVMADTVGESWHTVNNRV